LEARVVPAEVVPVGESAEWPAPEGSLPVMLALVATEAWVATVQQAVPGPADPAA
jgi:hypothetical protein